MVIPKITAQGGGWKPPRQPTPRERLLDLARKLDRLGRGRATPEDLVLGRFEIIGEMYDLAYELPA